MEGCRKYRTKQWVKVRAKVGIEYQKDYHGEGQFSMVKCRIGCRDQGYCTVLKMMGILAQKGRYPSYFINKSGCKRGAGRASHLETMEDSVKLAYDYTKRKCLLSESASDGRPLY